MKLLRLHVSGYKNLGNIEFDFSKANGCALIVGTNGSGKSNLLEVVSAIFSACYYEKKNVESDFRFELEYIIERLRTASAGGGPSYAFPLRVMIRNVDGKIEVQVYQNDEWLYVNKKEWFVVLPEHVIAIYSGEEKRLWEDYYFDSYEDFNKQYMSGKSYSTQRMLYFNKYYWDLFASILAVHDIEEHKQFLETINISGINKIKCTFDLKKIRDNKNEMAKEILKIINPDNLGEVELSLDKYEELKFLIGYEQEILFNMMVLVLYKEFKIITDFHIVCSNERIIKDLSEGEKKMLLIYGALNIVEGEGLVLLDEPDAHIHEGIKKEIYNLIKGASNENQFIVTSHSPTMTSLFEPQQVMMLDCVDGKTNVVYGDITKAINTLTDGQWGYIDHTIFLDKSRPLLLVEGGGDVKYIRHAIKVLSEKTPDYKILSNMDIIHCGGATCIKDTLTEIYPCLPQGKKTIALFDRDEEGGKGIHSIINKGKDRNDTSTYQRGDCYYLKLPKTTGHGKIDFVIEDYFTKQFKKDVAQSFLDNVNGEFNNFTRDLKQAIKDKLAKDLDTYDDAVMQGFKVLLDKILSIINGTEIPIQV